MTEPDYQAVFYATPVLYVVLDPDYRIVEVNDRTLQVTSRRREDLVGRDHFECFPENPADVAAGGERTLRASFARVKATLQSDTMAVQKWDLPKTGGGFETYYWSPTNHPVLEGGTLKYILHRVEDVTALVSAKEQEHANVDRLAAEVLRRSDELKLINTRLRVTQEELRVLNHALEARVAERTAELETSNAALKREMADRERMEEQFRQAQKLEAIGQLAGGIAHDFNNLLTVILGCAEGLKDQALTAAGASDLEDIRQAALRAASLTSQLLAFSRRNLQTPVVLDLDEVVQRAEGMLQRLVGENVTLVSKRGRGLWNVEIDRGLAEQAILNLVVNARDAMPRGGTVSIATRNVELGAATPGAVLGAPPGRYVELSVHDEGPGLAPSTRERMFLPFFTTKGVGQGTGLGLSMVHGMVKQAQGEIIVESEVGQGTTFRLCFPVVDKPLHAVPEPGNRAPRKKATERVMLVEDEAQVRQVTQRALESEGYSVVSFGSPAAALAWWKGAVAPVDLVLSDVVMPGLDGPTLVAELGRVRAGFAVLYMSGYTGGALVQRSSSLTPEAFLHKPFTTQVLLDRVRAALDARQKKSAAS